MTSPEDRVVWEADEDALYRAGRGRLATESDADAQDAHEDGSAPADAATGDSAELAGLRAEVERLRERIWQQEDVLGYARLEVHERLGELVLERQAAEAKVAAVEALADKWIGMGVLRSMTGTEFERETDPKHCGSSTEHVQHQWWESRIGYHVCTGNVAVVGRTEPAGDIFHPEGWTPPAGAAMIAVPGSAQCNACGWDGCPECDPDHPDYPGAGNPALNCPVCGSGEFGDCVCVGRTEPAPEPVTLPPLHGGYRPKPGLAVRAEPLRVRPPGGRGGGSTGRTEPAPEGEAAKVWTFHRFMGDMDADAVTPDEAGA